MPLTQNQLARQRQIAERDLTSLAEIHRYAEVINNLGERVKTWAPVATNVPARLSSVASATGRERLRLEAIAQVTQWIVSLPFGTDVTSKDRLYVNIPGEGMRSFDVSQVLGRTTDEVRRRALVDEVS